MLVANFSAENSSERGTLDENFLSMTMVHLGQLAYYGIGKTSQKIQILLWCIFYALWIMITMQTTWNLLVSVGVLIEATLRVAWLGNL